MKLMLTSIVTVVVSIMDIALSVIFAMTVANARKELVVVSIMDIVLSVIVAMSTANA